MANMISALTSIGGPYDPTPGRKRFTQAECEFLECNGVLTGRYELIDGEIIFKMSQNPPHKLTLALIAEWLRLLFGGLYVITQSPIDVNVTDAEINEPEPDITVLAQPITAFAARNIVSSDLVLLVEVSDSTLRYDLRNKAALYARAGIVEYWVADIVGRRFIVHREPGESGYAQVTEYAANETISSLAHPETQVRVADLLPPAV